MATVTGPATARMMKYGGRVGVGMLLPFSSSLTWEFNGSRKGVVNVKSIRTTVRGVFSSLSIASNSLHFVKSYCVAPNSSFYLQVSPPDVAASSLENNSNTDGNNKEERKDEVAAASSGSEDSAGNNIKELGSMLDIRVGRIIKAWRHEEADSLYVEEVDVGEAEPRIICSGLVKYIPLSELQERKVVILANLKARNMRGVKSNGILMAASDASHETVELLEPPQDSLPGERISFGSSDDNLNQPPPASPNQIQKKKIWESVQPHLKTDDSCRAMLGEDFMQTSAGVVVCRSLKKANIS